MKTKHTTKYTAKDMRKVGYMLEPLVCKHCKSDEVVYNQYSDSASCQACGQDQDKRTKHSFKYSSVKSQLMLTPVFLCECGKISTKESEP
jgi:ribosomal protein S27E